MRMPASAGPTGPGAGTGTAISAARGSPTGATNARSGMDAVLVLDRATNEIVTRIPVGASPHHPLFTPDGKVGMVEEVVTPDHVAHIVSRWTGIPVDRMLEGERAKLLGMEEALGKVDELHVHRRRVLQELLRGAIDAGAQHSHCPTVPRRARSPSRLLRRRRCTGSRHPV